MGLKASAVCLSEMCADQSECVSHTHKTHTHACTHSLMYTHTHTHTHTHTCRDTDSLMYAYIHTHIHTLTVLVSSSSCLKSSFFFLPSPSTCSLKSRSFSSRSSGDADSHLWSFRSARRVSDQEACGART